MRQVSLAEAARILGVSEKTIRRWLIKGKLSGHQWISDTGPRWIVELPDDAADGEPSAKPLDFIPKTIPAAPEVIDQLNRIEAMLAALLGARDITLPLAPPATLELEAPETASPGLLARVWSALRWA